MKKVDENRIEELLGRLTLDEKLGMIHGSAFFHTSGVPRLGIPALNMSDGPRGVRYEYCDDRWEPVGRSNDYVTFLPSNSALAMTWNRRLAYRTGKVLGEEARGRGKDIILAPGVNIRRNPLCGRNFEYFSEDPYLTGELAAELIKGIQESDVAACVKHFAVNSQETDRKEVDSVVDERTLREIYFPAFKKAVEKGGTYSVMSAYNKLNGEYCSQNRYLLGSVLRGEWGYDGMIVSDWTGVHNTYETATGPLDIEMGVTANFNEYYFADPLKELIEKGEIPESVVDEKVRNILRLMLRLNMLEPECHTRERGCYNTPAHREAVLEAARESITLLKNSTLPLDKEALREKLVAVIGVNADRLHANGGGSAEIKALYEISPLMGISMKLGGAARIEYAPGYHIPEADTTADPNWNRTTISGETPEQTAERSAAKLEEALELARRADEVIFVGGLNHDFDVEGQDRKNIELPYMQDELISKLLDIKPEMKIVILAGSVVALDAWADRAKNLLFMSYAGSEAGNALADIIFGDACPSGKLADTFPVRLEHTGAARYGEMCTVGRVEHRDGLKVGYRFFDTDGVRPLFEFGYGLSYTKFNYGKAKMERCNEGSGAVLKISVPVTNTGTRKGSETVQVYVSALSNETDGPEKELKGFEKQEIEPGETKIFEIKLDAEAFAYFNVDAGCFMARGGSFDILIGSSSRYIREKINVKLEP